MRGVFYLLIILIVSATSGCNQTNYRSEAKSGTTVSSNLQQKTDRPSEQGAGLPGYSVFCAIDGEQTREIDVGCKIVDGNDQRVKTPNTAWEDYELIVNNPPAELVIEKSLPNNRQNWDVLFTMSQLPVDELIDLAATANFKYDGVVNSGERVIVDSQNGQQSTSEDETATEPTPADPSTVALNCPNGLARGGVCYFKSTESCANACALEGAVPHRAVVDLIGSGAQDSGQLCLEVAQSIESNPALPLNLVNGPLGLGCHIRSDGVALDQTGTNTAANPPGDIALICACESP